MTNPLDNMRKAINIDPLDPVLEAERENIGFFESLPLNDRARVDFGTVRGTQFLEPLFEFSGACAGCGETPYLKLLTQLFGERATVANATGCSSIYGGNLPTTPWSKNADGRGPAWSNSLFEDNAEFGLGLRLAADQHTRLARELARGSCATRWATDARGRDPRGPSRSVRPSSRPSGTGSPSSGAGSPSSTGRRVADLRSVADKLVREASGSSAATAGPTTSGRAGSTTSSPAAATSTSWCSTPRSTPTPAASRRRRRPSAPSRSSPPAARRRQEGPRPAWR